jgi:large subunit ribosomal protein L25
MDKKDILNSNSDFVTLKGSFRHSTGKNFNRKLKMNNCVPAIVYSKGEDSLNITLEQKDLLKSSIFKYMYVKMIIEDEKEFFAAIKDIQIDVITRKVIHVDFLRVDNDKNITVKLPIKIINSGKALRQQDIRLISKYVTIKCMPQSFPKTLDIDVTTYQKRSKIKASHINLNQFKNAKLSDDIDKIICIIK